MRAIRQLLPTLVSACSTPPHSTFSGAKTNYDGSGRDASGNNTLYAFAWLAF
jgi:hypothetical protein